MITLISKKSQKLRNLLESEIEDLKFTTFKKLLKNKDIKVNGKRISENIELNKGDEVVVYLKLNDKKTYEIVFEDDNILVINKYKGITAEDLFERLRINNDDLRFIHRLDRNTDGLIVFAKNEKAEASLLKGFKERTFDKYYHAVCYGVPKIKDARLTAYLEKDENLSKVTIYQSKTKNSVKIITQYKVIEEYENSSLLEVKLITGKTHQIRAHLAFIGHFVIGDGKYGKEEINKIFKAKEQKLTAKRIVLHFEKDDFLSYLDGKVFEV